MKINSLKIDGYKNLFNCKLDLEGFNVIVGANNCGKSNFLEIFKLLNYIIYGSDDVRKFLFSNGFLPHFGNFIPKNIHTSDLMLSIELEYTQKIKNTTYKYFYEIKLYYPNINMALFDSENGHNAYIYSECLKFKNIKNTGVAKTIFNRSNKDTVKISNGQKVLKLTNTESAISIISKLKDIYDALEDSAKVGLELMKSICMTPILYFSPSSIKEIQNSLQNVDKEHTINGRITSLNLKREIINILKSKDKQYFEEVLNDLIGLQKFSLIELGDDNEHINFKFLSLEFLNNVSNTLTEISDGTLITLNLVTYLFTRKYSMIAIEELENSLHPKLLKKIIRLIKNNFYDTQILITTHSTALLNMVDIKDVNVMSTSSLGHSSIFKVSDKKNLVKQLSSSPFASFSDIFFMDEEFEHES